MLAARFMDVDRLLVLDHVPDPTPGPGEVVIAVGRCGICGSDLHRAHGPRPFSEGTIPGHEFAGEVVALGAGVESLRIGDNVAAMPFMSCGQCRACMEGDPSSCTDSVMMGTLALGGGFAEYVKADARWCVRLPKSVSIADGALVEPLACSLRAIRRSGMRYGDRILVIGAGPIGVGVAHWARRHGAGAIAVYAASRRREAIARAMGADHFLTVDADRPIGDQVNEALGGPADIVFECSGVAGALDEAVAAVRLRGQIVAPGFCWTEDTVHPMQMMFKEAALHFTKVYDLEEFELAVRAFDSGHVEPRAMVTGQVKLEGAPDAFRSLLENNAHCKLLIAMD